MTHLLMFLAGMACAAGAFGVYAWARWRDPEPVAIPGEDEDGVQGPDAWTALMIRANAEAVAREKAYLANPPDWLIRPSRIAGGKH